MKLEFSRKISENTQIKFHENPSSGIRVVPYGQTAGHYEADIRGSQFCERALKKINLLIMVRVVTCSGL
jgi:hypothetical protein